MYQLVIVVHVFLGLGVIGLILMQQGKGADAGAAFGSGSSGSVFGAQGAASFLSRTTAILATLFFSTSLGLAVLSGHQGRAKDLMDTAEIEQKKAENPVLDAEKAVAPVVAVPAADVPAVAVEEKNTPEITEKPAPVEKSNTEVETDKKQTSEKKDKK